jgi:hypothetical protein
MARATLIAVLPWLAFLLLLLLAAWALVRFSRAHLRLGRLLNLHRDETGSVQSLSFVLTLPLFIFIMLFIIQVSQLMIGMIVVQYAAFAAARSAAVWIPAGLPAPEGTCCISSYEVDPDAPDQVAPETNPKAADYGPSSGGLTYKIDPSGDKYDKIKAAAVLACMPISPSRDVGLGDAGRPHMAAAIKNAYGTLAPSSSANSKIGPRIDHKLAYAIKNTQVEIRFFHKNEEPPLQSYDLGDDINDLPLHQNFYPNEIGWQDTITVKVIYNFPLLPGPGRLLAKFAPRPGGRDLTAESIQKNGGVYTYPLEAESTIGNEGEKSSVPYLYNPTIVY